MTKNGCKDGLCETNIPELSIEEKSGQKGFVKASKIIWSFELNSSER
jgi:hypothetical protein